ncbi:putative L,D-transpeptidase YbiS OS=Afipia felis OX=1035 GN=ybiS_2 PE=3 SV=1 [Afipia felis]
MRPSFFVLATLRVSSALAVATCLSACVSTGDDGTSLVSAAVPPVAAGEPEPQFMRQYVDDPTGQSPGTIVVDPANHYLYLVQQGGKALRYGVGVGRAGMAWSGTANVAYKREWPSWTPTKNMIARDPKTYSKWAKGMDGGEANPLGARALYLFQGGKDTLYRIHGTNEPWSIGKSMSSGCIRMMNQDVIDLYRRIPKGTKVVVLPVTAHSAARNANAN